ncbi:MAG: selenocysteine-specific translation elongation factor [Thermoleophilaceae bacterium]|nr:selenocysteine-specific translation elongation factor [Thermoleophilaceae bacterium]
MSGPEPAPLTLGTAGHIDHGKTALVTALTGTSTDRLPEERERGISIELGYAQLALPSGRTLSVVDVPGHERFVRTMVAGATGVDLYLLCVAADDGVMPQTREHLAVLRQLGVRDGVAAITKADACAPEPAAEEVAALVPGVEIVAVSALERTGLDELLAALDRVARRLPGRAGAAGPPRLHVDRSFTLRGIGTVVTGTLWSGSFGAGDRVSVLPRGLEARVRSAQVHGRPVERAAAGQRVALSLAGVGWRELRRGDVVTVPGADLSGTYIVDAEVELEPGAEPLRRGERLHVHHGTRAAPARIVPLEAGGLRRGERGLAQLRLEAPLVPCAGDRVILRRLAPPDTIGGGEVIDPRARRHGPSTEVVARLRSRGGSERPGPERVDQPPRAPEPPAPEPLGEAALRLAALLDADGAEPRADGELAAAAGLSPARAQAELGRLERAGLAVRVGRNLHYAPDALAALEARIAAILERDGRATLAGVRDELGTSRRYAQALLEHLDRRRVTRRVGDAHLPRRRR